MRGGYRAGHREPAEGERFGKRKKIEEVSQLLQGEEFERTELLKEDIKKCYGLTFSVTSSSSISPKNFHFK